MFFFFNDTATTEIYPLSLHDALPIFFSHWMWRCAAFSSTAPNGCARHKPSAAGSSSGGAWREARKRAKSQRRGSRAGKDTAVLPSPSQLVCPVLLCKKKNSQLALSAL